MKKQIITIAIIASFLGLVFILSGIQSEANAASPASVTIDKCKEKKSAVAFPHATHDARLADKCDDCHQTATGGPLKLDVAACKGQFKNLFHDVCLACHKAEEKGPIACAECHK